MGTFSYSIEVGPSRAGPFVHVDAIVDTGATYSQIPRSTLEQLGINPISRRNFTMADGRTTVREIVEVHIRLDGQVRSTLCVIGEAGMPALLGAYTLEGFGLTADPVNRRLVETTLYLLEFVDTSLLSPRYSKYVRSPSAHDYGPDFLNCNARELMQNRFPVAVGPSSNT